MTPPAQTRNLGPQQQAATAIANPGQDINELFVINSIGFNPRFEYWLFSLGNDGVGYFWDCKSKNKVCQFSYGGIPASKGRVSPDGQVFVYALGYDWSQGVWGCPSVNYRPKICAHHVTQNELEHKKQEVARPGGPGGR